MEIKRIHVLIMRTSSVAGKLDICAAEAKSSLCYQSFEVRKNFLN